MFQNHLQRSKSIRNRIKNDIEFEAKLRLDLALFERKKIELQTQVKELEKKHPLLEEESELDPKMTRICLENDDVHFQSSSIRDKLTFNCTQGTEISRIDLAKLTSI